jgi:hypothetical protein
MPHTFRNRVLIQAERGKVNLKSPVFKVGGYQVFM